MTINGWIAGIAGGALVLVLGALAVMLVINADLRASIAADNATKVLLLAQNKEWAAKAAATDVALAAIKTADAANARAIAKAESAAALAAKKLKDQAAAIAGIKFAGSDCEQVMALRNAYLEHRR